MTKEALWNLQHGVPEDRRYLHTTYNPESDLDRWVLTHVELMENTQQTIDKKRQHQIEKDLEKEVSRALESVLKGFNR